MTSTSFIIGTGLKKCKPPKRSCLVVQLAMSVIGKDEVLLANMVCSGANLSSLLKSSCLTSKFSTIASTTRSVLCTTAVASVLVLRFDNVF